MELDTSMLKVIKYEGNNSTFVWKHPMEDFNDQTQLIVHETQEAILFAEGKALDLFGPGRHILNVKNIPLLRNLMNLSTEGETAFHCEVYFINKTEQMAIKWGTDTKVEYIEPTYRFPLSIGASGEMALSVADSRKLLLKLVGTENELTRDSLVRYFRAFLMTRVKSYIAQEMRKAQTHIFEIDEKLTDFSSTLKNRLWDDFNEYGVELKQFMVTNIVKPDGEPQYDRFKDLYFRQYTDIREAELQQQLDLIEQDTKAKQMVIEAKGLAQKRQLEGYTYQQERGFDVAQDLAKNESGAGTPGGMTNLGIGLGMMAGVGRSFSHMMNGMVDKSIGTVNGNMEVNGFCDQCGAKLMAGAAFCDTCGAAQSQFGRCSNCGYQFTKESNFCPKCGKKKE